MEPLPGMLEPDVRPEGCQGYWVGRTSGALVALCDVNALITVACSCLPPVTCRFAVDVTAQVNVDVTDIASRRS